MELLENEIAKEIEGYEEYFITTFSRVWSNQSARWLKASKRKDKYYRVCLCKNRKRTCLYIHRLIAIAFIPNPESKPFVDHIDGDKENNKIENLRWATNQENNYNSKLNITNTSGVKGVKFHKPAQKWCARISINGKQTHLGLFNTIEEATHARRTKAFEIQGIYMNPCEKLYI